MNEMEYSLLEILINETEWLNEPQIREKYLSDYQYKDLKNNLATIMSQFKREGLVDILKEGANNSLEKYKISPKGRDVYYRQSKIRLNENKLNKKIKNAATYWWASPLLALVAVIFSFLTYVHEHEHTPQLTQRGLPKIQQGKSKTASTPLDTLSKTDTSKKP